MSKLDMFFEVTAAASIVLIPVTLLYIACAMGY